MSDSIAAPTDAQDQGVTPGERTGSMAQRVVDRTYHEGGRDKHSIDLPILFNHLGSPSVAIDGPGRWGAIRLLYVTDRLW
jgi:hypothetical protein